MTHIGRDALAATLSAIKYAGRGRCESAVFWLGIDTPRTVSAIVVPVGSGVEWHQRWLRLSVEWMLELNELCETRREMVVGVVHSHPTDAFFSDIDADGFFHAPGCLSLVLPQYGKTSLGERQRWALMVGEEGGIWRRANWSDEIALEADSVHEVIRLEVSRR
jgi:hypothetical protein